MSGSNFPDYLNVLEGWFGDEMSEINGRLAPPGTGLLMGAPIWGQHYVDRFAWYCLPSLLAPQNLAALRDNCRLVLFTDRASWAPLWNVLRGLEHGTGIEVILREIPQPVMDGIYNQQGSPVDNKYWALGVAGQLCLQMAGRANMAFHMLAPDHVYAATYFENLFRIADGGYEAIAQPGISASLTQELHAELYTYKQEDGSLAIPDRDLGTMGWRHLHPQTQENMITDKTIPDNLPLSHLWVWQGEDRLYLSSCHMNAAYLSPRLCAIAPTRIPATIDAELPAFFPEKFYVPKADDGLTFIELSDASKPHDARKGNLEAFVAACCEKTAFQEDWAPFTREVYEIPIHPQETFVDEAKIRHQHAWLLAQLQDERPTMKAKAAYKLIHAWRFKYR